MEISSRHSQGISMESLLKSQDIFPSTLIESELYQQLILIMKLHKVLEIMKIVLSGVLIETLLLELLPLLVLAVVNISVIRFHGMMLGKSIGPGTIIDPDGTISTCAHVVVDFQSVEQINKV